MSTHPRLPRPGTVAGAPMLAKMVAFCAPHHVFCLPPRSNVFCIHSILSQSPWIGGRQAAWGWLVESLCRPVPRGTLCTLMRCCVQTQWIGGCQALQNMTPCVLCTLESELSKSSASQFILVSSPESLLVVVVVVLVGRRCCCPRHRGLCSLSSSSSSCRPCCCPSPCP